MTRPVACTDVYQRRWTHCRPVTEGGSACSPCIERSDAAPPGITQAGMRGHTEAPLSQGIAFELVRRPQGFVSITQTPQDLTFTVHEEVWDWIKTAPWKGLTPRHPSRIRQEVSAPQREVGRAQSSV